MVTCPHCKAALSEHWVGGSGAEEVCVFTCQQCAGVWLDQPALATVCPTLSHLPERHLEIQLTTQPGTGIQRCPRCQDAASLPPYEVVVLEVAVDFCARCGGIWLDGGEYNESSVPTPRPQAVPGYRQRAVGKEMPLRCVHCQELLERERALIREHGPTCPACSFALDQRCDALLGQQPALTDLLDQIAKSMFG